MDPQAGAPGRARRARWAATTAAAVGLVGLGAFPAGAASAIGSGDVEVGDEGWYSYGPDGTSTEVVDGRLCTVVPGGTANVWDAAVQLDGVSFEAGQTYTLTYTASATTDTTITVQLGGEWPEVFQATPTVTSTPQTFTSTFTPDWSATPGTIAFQLGGHAEALTFCLDDVSLTSDVELLPHTSFAEGLGPWGMYGGGTPVTAEGATCMSLPGGQPNPWDAGLTYDGVAIEEGQNYVLTVRASADPGTPVRVLVGEAGGAYRTVFDDPAAALTPELATYTFAFTAGLSFPSDGDAPGQVAIQLGKNTAYDFCVTDVSLRATAAPPPAYEPDTGSRVRVNQVGYLPDGPKGATLVTDAVDALPWELVADGGTVVASGTTEPRGTEPSSDLPVHVIDFSDVTTPGSGFTLVADGETSLPFDIDADLYQQLRYDALNYFYLARSGIEIDAAVVGEEYARPAGHVGVAPNQGDVAVPCIGPRDYYDGWTCDYALDVTGGWYDAGDHGKYVVNGGIAVAQLLSTYERTLTAPTATAGALDDGSLNLPEHGNGVPDVLDEARWELEWMLTMVVPSGEYAGMVHHKVHDEGWTGLPLDPAADPQVRSLHRPSTAATLNVAAVAAQGARLFDSFDPDFSAQLLDAARTTWAAAVEHPDVYAPAAAGNDGGGPYDDSDVTDEFYWAAAELYVTTGEDVFAQAVLDNPRHTEDIFGPQGFDWGSTAPLGRMTLATVPNDLPGLAAVRDSVVAGAEKHLAAQQVHGFASSYTPSDGVYTWGSNATAVNNLVVLGVAFDLTGDARFQRAVLGALDYLLGRNALNQSYVTGYGDVFSTNQHSRMFANQIDPALPTPPVGSLAGGPNSVVATWDPTMQAAFTDGCAPSMCYLDEIQSWASNEITVNWNSALSWVASFVADQAGGAVVVEPGPSAPVVTEQPADTRAALGSRATFTAAATGVPEPTVSWQWRWRGGPWLTVPRADSETLSVRVSIFSLGTEYRAVFTNAQGTATTQAARLAVTWPRFWWRLG